MSSSSGSSSRRSRIAASMSNVMYTNAVYFPNHRVYSGDTPGQLNYGCINHVYYAFATVMQDGQVLLSDMCADLQAPCDGVDGAIGSLRNLKDRHPHLRVVLSIGGAGSHDIFPVVASDPFLRDNFAQSALGLMEASGMDGIDIVWEYPSDEQQGADFLSLVATMRAYLSEDQLLTACLPANQAVLQCIDLGQAALYLDFLNLTAYDFFGAWTPRTGHQAQLYTTSKDETSAAGGVAFLMKAGVPGKKILLGIPVFGRSFLHAAGPGQKYKGVGGHDGSFEYKDLPRRGTKEQIDKRAVAAQCVGADGGFVTYDNPDTVKMKAAFCKQKGLGGLFYWCAPMDSRDSKRSLIASGFRALHSS